MEKRWIQMDIARGLGILLIVFVHSWFVANSPELLYPLLFSFGVPLFFFISGVFFNPHQPFVEMAIRKADALLKPFFFTLLLYVIVRAALRHQPLMPDIGGVLYASVNTIPWQALWFLPHFWLAILFSWLMLRLMQRLGLSLTTCCVVLAAQLLLGIETLGGFWQLPVTFAGRTFVLPGLPFSMDLTLVSSAYFMLGYLLRNILHEHQTTLLTLCIGIAIFAGVFLYSGATLDLAQRRYDHWLWTTVLALSGCYVCWALSRLIMSHDWLSKAMTYIGQSTLILLIFHGEIQHKSFDVLDRFGLPNKGAAFVALLMAVAVPLLISEVIKRVGTLQVMYHPLPARPPAPVVGEVAGAEHGVAGKEAWWVIGRG